MRYQVVLLVHFKDVQQSITKCKSKWNTMDIKHAYVCGVQNILSSHTFIWYGMHGVDKQYKLLQTCLMPDEGMTHGSSILVYLVFGPGRTSTERMARPISTIVWGSPEARLGVQGKARRTRPSRIRTWLGFIRTVFICKWLGEQSRDPTFVYKRLGGRSSRG
jgi:hypothetical protein